MISQKRNISSDIYEPADHNNIGIHIWKNKKGSIFKENSPYELLNILKHQIMCSTENSIRQK